MRMLDGRRDEWRRTALALKRKWVTALGDAPTVIRTTLRDDDHLPQVLPDIADPEMSFCVEMDPPWIAKAVRPEFTASIRDVEKRIVPRNGVSPIRSGVLDINADHSRIDRKSTRLNSSHRT